MEITWDEDAAEKGGYETFMLKEIHEQPDAVAETIADRLPTTTGSTSPTSELDDDFLKGIERIVIVACGTSYHAGLVGRYAIEQWARVPVEMDIASEYRYRNPVHRPNDLVIGITQSGETADTLAAMRLARERGAKVLAITNVMGSQATRDADAVLYTRAGLEISVAATKTFVAQVAAMYLLGAAAGRAARDAAAGAHRRAGRRAEARSPRRSRRRSPPATSACADRARRSTSQRFFLVPRPPHRPAGLPRGRAEAEGDLLHPDRRLRRRRDEARADRAARRVDPGRLRRHRQPGAWRRSSPTSRRSAPAAPT